MVYDGTIMLPDSKLKDILIGAGLIDEKAWGTLAAYAGSAHVSMSSALMEKGIVTDEQLGSLIGSHINVPFVVVS